MTATLALMLSLAVVAAGGPTGAEAERDFSAANDKVLKGDFTEATRLYTSLLERGVENADVYYNLGNAYAGQERSVDAVVAWERAIRLDPAHADARANLEVLRARLARDVPAPAADAGDGAVALADVLRPLLAPFPPAPFAWALVVAELLLAAAIWGLRRRAGGRGALVGLAVVSGLVLLLAGAVTVGHHIVRAEPLAVAKVKTELRQGPDARFGTAGWVAPGARVRVVEADGAWRRVQQQDGTSGWVAGETLEAL
ncbi:MAG: SH3 domain-containing protein [Deltaproteobacteria bacterium]|nr:SH3 domain-containing protein [Deltaproteobacteria bacterium]